MHLYTTPLRKGSIIFPLVPTWTVDVGTMVQYEIPLESRQEEKNEANT